MNKIPEWLHIFSGASCFYRQLYMLPLWNKYPRYDHDIWDSLSIFLEGYAFERQGRRPDYFHAGVDALFYCRNQTNGDLTSEVAYRIWQRFSQLLNNNGLNHRNNPLYPSTNPARLRNIGRKLSIIEMTIRNNIANSNQTFATYLQNLIIQNQDVRKAFNLLRTIRGIGSKVASFYLRDLVDITNTNLDNIQNRQLLQPVDIWIERTIKTLANDQHMTREQIANWIVNTSLQHDTNPEQVNMGIWFYCSNIAGSEYRVHKVLNNPKKGRELLNEFKTKIKNTCNNCLDD